MKIQSDISYVKLDRRNGASRENYASEFAVTLHRFRKCHTKMWVAKLLGEQSN